MKSFANIVFKFVAVIQVLAALFFLFTFGTLLIGLLAGGNANDLLAAAGRDQVELPLFAFFGAMIVSLFSTLLYSASAFGFFTMRQWQPALFTVLIVFSIVEIIYNAFVVGFDIRLIFSAIAIVIYAGLLVLVWMNKDMFGKETKVKVEKSV